MAQHLIQCLDFEMKKKTNEGKLSYMKTMWRWLVDHQWEESEEEMQDNSKLRNRLMEQNLSNLIRPMSVVAQEAINYISGRREHSITSLKTRWVKFNKQCMGGIEPNTVYTIAGISGSGKSSFANEISTDIVDLNPSEEIVILIFSLEMVGFRQVGRTLSSKLRKTTSTLYSSETDLDDDTFRKVISVSNQLKEYPIWFVDNPTTPKEAEDIIKYFYNTYVKVLISTL